jgi:hypothetical protein
MVESFFAIMSKQFDPIWGEAYAGRDAKQRSEQCAEALHKHEMFLAGKYPNRRCQLASEFIAVADKWLEGYTRCSRTVAAAWKGSRP